MKDSPPIRDEVNWRKSKPQFNSDEIQLFRRDKLENQFRLCFRRSSERKFVFSLLSAKCKIIGKFCLINFSPIARRRFGIGNSPVRTTFDLMENSISVDFRKK